MSTAAKVFEAETAIADGADEIDYVVNVSDVKDGRWDRVKEEMARITEACHSRGAGCKVIFENCYLTKEEIVRLAEIAKAAGGIRDWASCKAMIEAGAERIGASAGKQILEEFSAE